MTCFVVVFLACLLAQTLAWCLGGVGAFLVVRKAARQVMRRWREHQARERIRKALQQDGVIGWIPDTADLEANQPHSSKDPAAGVCVVCLTAPSEMVYVKCGHMCCCSKCTATLNSRRCPVCRTEGSVIKVYRT